MILTYYHTQENRGEMLREPIMCKHNNAWLGNAYYFWENEEDAFFGEEKQNTKLVNMTYTKLKFHWMMFSIPFLTEITIISG